MRQPVSVVIPTYNRAHTVGRAIDSVMMQICPQDEIIVVDDGSIDNTKEIVARFGSKVRYLTQPNGGAGAARNRGVSAAQNDLIAFLDSDDEWLPGKLEKQCRFMAAHPDVVMCFSDFQLRFADGRIAEGGIHRWAPDSRSWEERLGQSRMLSELCDWSPGEDDVAVHIGDLYYQLMTSCCVSAFTAMVRRSLAGEALYFTVGLKMYEDWACFGRVVRKGPVALFRCNTAIQNGHVTGRLTDADSFTRAAARIVVLEEVWGADAAFLQAHGEEHQALLDKQRITKTAGLISEGKMAAARSELAKVHDAPFVHRFLSLFPGSVIKAMLSARRKLLLTGQA